MYRSMIIGEAEKIISIPFKHIMYFAGLVVCAILIFRFGFMNIIGKMNKGKSFRGSVKEKVIEEAEQEKSESKEENLNQIMGIINRNYIVKTRNGR